MTILFFIITVSFIMLIDPYGLLSLDGKFTKFTCYCPDTPKTINDRINIEKDYYVLGSSRMMRVDPMVVSKILNKSVANIHINGPTLFEHSILLEKIKNKNKNFIMGFDVFTLNKNLEDSNFKRIKLYEEELKKNNTFIFEPFISIDYLSDSFEHINYKLNNKKITYWLELEDNKKFPFDAESIENRISGKIAEGFYVNYKAYNDDFVKKIAMNTNENDIFVLFPKYALYYKFFQQYQNIETQYFQALKTLVNNTKAKVISFYGINDITMNKDNFDANGWHFKPKFTEAIFSDLFTDTPKYGIILTKYNIDSHLTNLRKQISDYNLSNAE